MIVQDDVVQFLKRLDVEAVESPIGAFNELYRFVPGTIATVLLLLLLLALDSNMILILFLLLLLLLLLYCYYYYFCY